MRCACFFFASSLSAAVELVELLDDVAAAVDASLTRETKLSRALIRESASLLAINWPIIESGESKALPISLIMLSVSAGLVIFGKYKKERMQLTQKD